MTRYAKSQPAEARWWPVFIQKGEVGEMAGSGNGKGQVSRLNVGHPRPAFVPLLAVVLLQTLWLPLLANGQSLFGVGHDPLAFVRVNPGTGALTQIANLPPDAEVARAGAIDPGTHRVFVGLDTKRNLVTRW
jgi:hypothetical protein